MEQPRSRLVRRRRIITIVSVLVLLSGLYLLSILLAPRVGDNNAPQAAASQPQDNRVIIPSASINAPYFQGGEEALDRGVWHRHPERGDPEAGGNFILTGHRFVFSAAPWYTKERSTFYNIVQVQEGDEVIVHWEGQSYTYRVVKKYQVKPHHIEVEALSRSPKLTLYSCTLGGSYDGREVIEAEPVE